MVWIQLGRQAEVTLEDLLQKAQVAANPESYVAGLAGWQADCVRKLRGAVTSAAPFSETIKWGHLVYLANGPAVLIRAEADRVLLGLWRGQRLKAIEPRLEPGGKYEMARLVLREGDAPDTAARLAAEAHRLNVELGDPTDLSR
ncbi:DUF1801 domain-containing protein [Phenylobacterium sp.]|uniref:DUF1801 domain-containing protein n=1 Tax=Phenylobacterium sp. TaxID=1871053 RepID=UPI002736E6FD|nr:DUF1801 domain-containing protein [Phenylobacterium sp.]MDP3661107.1 DUF1801 domain-containing protein [Phenylobacterium sp.]